MVGVAGKMATAFRCHASCHDYPHQWGRPLVLKWVMRKNVHNCGLKSLKALAERQTREPCLRDGLSEDATSRHYLRSKGREGAKQRSRANNTLGSSVSQGIKEGQWCATEVLSGPRTGGQRAVHVSCDRSCTICMEFGKAEVESHFGSKTKEFTIWIYYQHISTLYN